MTEPEVREYGSPPRRKYEINPPALRGPGQRLSAWTCQCKRPDGRPLLRAHRHAQEMDCIPSEEIEAWRKTSGCGPKTARGMYWMAKEFSQEAKTWRT